MCPLSRPVSPFPGLAIASFPRLRDEHVVISKIKRLILVNGAFPRKKEKKPIMRLSAQSHDWAIPEIARNIYIPTYLRAVVSAAATPRWEYFDTDADDHNAPHWAQRRHTSIPSYRGRPDGDEEERCWNPEMLPCVPSDHRPERLFNSREAAEAAGLTSREERFAPPAIGWDGAYKVECVEHKLALCRLRVSFLRWTHAPWRMLPSTTPVRVHVVVAPSRTDRGSSRPLSWASVTAGWMAGSSHAGALSGLVRVYPILCGECPHAAPGALNFEQTFKI